MGIEDKHLDGMLRSWEHEPTRDPEIHQKVRDRIHNEYFARSSNFRTETGFLFWLSTLIARPIYASLFLVIVIGSSVGFTALVHKKNQIRDREIPLVYRQLIDPATSFREEFLKYDNFQSINQSKTVSRKSMGRALQWIERKVDLDNQQAFKFERIHKHYFDEFEALYFKLIQLENQYRVYERQRIAGDDINLLSVFDNLNSQKEIYKRTLLVQQKFMQQVFQILNAEQKGKYDELFFLQTPKNISSAFLLNEKREWKI